MDGWMDHLDFRLTIFITIGLKIFLEANSRSTISTNNWNIISAQRVGFFSIGSGRLLDKIPGSRSGSGRVGVSENTIG